MSFQKVTKHGFNFCFSLFRHNARYLWKQLLSHTLPFPRSEDQINQKTQPFSSSELQQVRKYLLSLEAELYLVPPNFLYFCLNMYAVSPLIPGKIWISISGFYLGLKIITNPWFAIKRTPTTGKKSSLAKSNLIFPHSYNITLSAPLPNLSFAYGRQGISDTNLLYKTTLKKNT